MSDDTRMGICLALLFAGPPRYAFPDRLVPVAGKGVAAQAESLEAPFEARLFEFNVEGPQHSALKPPPHHNGEQHVQDNPHSMSSVYTQLRALAVKSTTTVVLVTLTHHEVSSVSAIAEAEVRKDPPC
ncbi:hypothetical protein CEXT_499931 [Caerostris extrusa]|uniref:Secreted protein n=1 Tax=Caerostris extrusa TaxID=172846 RepID=A0AAV4U2J8_CAEEX|nr:hypothetical protein CEXT_499931 [Caerostris extrusa]